MDFSNYPTYSNYRTLHRVEPLQFGYDVWALQIALSYRLSKPLDFDGWLGDQTATLIWEFQRVAKLTQDGLAGGITQRQLALYMAKKNVGGTAVPYALMKGQLEHESSYRLGCHSSVRDDGTYDAGVAQRNTAHTPAQQGFDPILSVQALVKTVEAAYARYSGVVPVKRRWGLAAGSWNAPAFANFIANEEGASLPPNVCAKPSQTAWMLIEDYIASVSAYL